MTNKIFKNILAVLCTLIIFFNYAFECSADIDGVFTGDEWDGAVVTKIFEGESNCGVNFALVHSMLDSENGALFLCFMHKDPSLEYGNSVTGVSLSVDGSGYFDVTASASKTYDDSSKHSFEGCVSVDENNGATTEIRVGFKYGLPKETECSVRFIDSAGALSNVYHFTVVNDEYTEPTEMIITQNEPEKTQKEKTVRAEKTTKKKKTTTKKSSKKTTTEATLKPTQKEETRKKSTYSRRTRTTREETTAATVKTTAAPRPATVYYYEKEVIISQVYVTQPELTEESKTSLPETTAVHTSSLIMNETETQVKSSFSLSEGTRKKTIIGIFAAISFTVIAAAGTRTSKKKLDNDDKTEPQ